MEHPLVVVTGAGRGIGRAIAEVFAENGFHVVLTARSIDQIEHVAAAIRTDGGFATAIECDVSSPKFVSLFAETLHKKVGKVSILINNAGIAPSAKIEDTTDAMWESAIGTNLSGAFYMSRAFVPDMKALGHGKILSIASTAAFKGFNYNTAYTASKHGLLGFTRALSVELEKYHIEVNAICPGFVRTDIVTKSIADIQARSGKTHDEAEASLAHLNTGGKLIEPEEVARLALSVIKNEKFVTGEAIMMDGMSF
jgi:NAD(P)-dependent dehydrogenase (short-subunit alcohol dehydrogenase family)